MSASAAKRLEWANRALQAYIDTLAHIADENSRTAELVRKRVEHALDLILEHPGIGIPTARRGERRYPIANTGPCNRLSRYAGSCAGSCLVPCAASINVQYRLSKRGRPASYRT